MPDRYSIDYTPRGLEFVRKALGKRPFDKVAPLIYDLERQKHAQDQAAAVPPAEAPAAEAAANAPAPVPALRRRANGHAEPDATADGPGEPPERATP
jgi:hypothetical protein